MKIPAIVLCIPKRSSDKIHSKFSVVGKKLIQYGNKNIIVAWKAYWFKHIIFDRSECSCEMENI